MKPSDSSLIPYDAHNFLRHAMIDEYLESKVSTATPYQLHLMVIDGAIRYATAAEAALERGDFPAARKALGQARTFVGEIVAGLDDKYVPEVVIQLRALFVFALRNLVTADLKRQAKPIADALLILNSHRETWLALAEKLNQESAAQAPKPMSERFCWSS
jgi:flagellar secretion chaperone FliS